MALPLLFLAAAAAAQPLAPAPNAATALEDGPGRPFMSPMGEPVFGQVPGEDGLVAWFRETDRNHDGVLTVDEMTADAERFFQILDSDHDGEIGPDEIEHYESVIAPRLHSRWIASGDDGGAQASETDWSKLHGRRGGGHRARAGVGGYGGDDEAAGGRYGLLEIPEPVASADADFNRGVSAEEFRNAAAQRFQLLDVDHRGRLTLPELQAIREAAASASRRPPKTSDEDQPPPTDDGDQPQY